MRSLFFVRARKLAMSFFAVALVFSMIPAAAMAEDTVSESDDIISLDKIDASNNPSEDSPASESTRVIGDGIVEIDDLASQDETRETIEPVVEDDETDAEEADAPHVVLFDMFEGNRSDYDFEAAKTILLNMGYKYSNTGGLAGIDAFLPTTVKALVVPQEDGTYECEIALPSKEAEGFRMTLDPSHLNYYLVKPPKGDETQQQLHEMLQNGDFAGDVEHKKIYAYQEDDVHAEPDYTVQNAEYHNRYSNEYNEAWNKARTLVVGGDAGFSAAIVDSDSNEHVGANALPNPKLVVNLTEAQLANAVENGLDITVGYRRNATQYTVKHWVPKDLSGRDDAAIADQGLETKSENGVDYVCLDTETFQGRIGALTRAVAKTEGDYETLVAEGFSQELIKGTDTVVGIHYKASDFYRVIFNTDYGYIPRQQVQFNGNVDLSVVGDPVRKGYTFGGWRYLKKDAGKDEEGNYADEDYVSIPKGTQSLQLTAELITQDALVTDTDGIKSLSLYPIWESDKTEVTVILWTESLNGSDVQAKAEGGKTDYYNNEKYKDYQNDITTTKPNKGGGNAEAYSNAKSFTVTVDTDSSLIKNEGVLTDEIQNRVVSEFADASKHYTQDSFEILHATDGVMDDSPTTADADGETAIYVYFTRNIYTLQFQYYGVTEHGTRICNNTNGFSFAAPENFNTDGSGVFNTDGTFNYDYGAPGIEGKKESNGYLTVKDPSNMPCPQTITIKAKYGADLRDVWPSARPETNLVTNEQGSFHAVSWATTAGGYNKNARESDNPEPTIIGLYATMDEGIIADAEHPEQVHHLAMYWYGSNELSYYRYNHCFELPKFDVNDAEGVHEIILCDKGPDGNPVSDDILRNKLYLVPVETQAISKYGFDDMLRVGYDEATKSVIYAPDTDYDGGYYYAVRGYVTDGITKYYAVGRRVVAPSSNSIDTQKPSARAHMQRVNVGDVADHTTQYLDTDGRTWSKGGEASKKVGMVDGGISPYDIYFYYDRENYTITYLSSSQREDSAIGDVELGHIELPYGTHVTSEYAFKLDMRDTNTAKSETGDHKYLWTYPTNERNEPISVPVCPDRSERGNAEWRFKGWGLGPAGANMQWTMSGEDASVPQAQEADDFYIDSNLLLYAIWETPMLKVTFHLNGGMLISRDGMSEAKMVETTIPANMSILKTSAVIPRPVRHDYRFSGWYAGKIDTDGNPIISDTEFHFDQPIINKDTHVFAMWEDTTSRRFDYTVYHVTPKLAVSTTLTPTHETVQLDADGNIVESGGTTYYVLSKDVKTNQAYVPHVNLSAASFSGYVPRETNKVLNPSETGSTAVFIYDARHAPGSSGFTMNFVEAGTESDGTPVLVKSVTVDADQAIMTPDADTAAALKADGYHLVNKESDGSYAPVMHGLNLTWLGADGATHRIDEMNALMMEGKAPNPITYLVKPTSYTITYENAEGSSLETDVALAGVTSDDDMSVETALAAGKNPTRYTVKDLGFVLRNPDRVQAADGKWYAFSHWTLGDGTVMRTSSLADGEAAYATLRVDPGTIGDLTFIANWVEAPEGDPVVTPDDPEDPTESDDPVRPLASTDSDDQNVPKGRTSLPTPSERFKVLSLAQTGDNSDLVPCLMLATLSGFVVIALFTRKLRKD